MKLFFKKRPLNDFTLGEMLCLRREEKKLSLERAAELSRTKRAYLQALEEGQYDRLPAGLYAKHVLRAYCACLGLSYRKMLARYEQERGGAAEEAPALIFGRERVRPSYFFLLPKVWRGSILVLILLAGFVYIGLRIRSVITPPALAIHFPPENYITDTHTVEISGTVDPQARLFINESEIVALDEGAFREAVDLKDGINDIVVRAQKKYGRDAVKARQILVNTLK